jgi:hypothetical protein
LALRRQTHASLHPVQIPFTYYKPLLTNLFFLLCSLFSPHSQVCGEEAMGMMHVGDLYSEPQPDEPIESLHWGDNEDFLGLFDNDEDMPTWLRDDEL